MKRIFRRALAGLGSLLVLGLGLLVAAIGLTILNSSASESEVAHYFSAGALPQDVLGQYRYLTALLDQPIESFRGYEGIAQRDWKFQLAFCAYAMASLAQQAPPMRREAAYYMDRLIQKMRQRPVWEDWVTDGYGPDPLAENNMMYRGHLSLMINLYQLISGEQKYEAEAARFAEDIRREMDGHPFCGVLCEPDNYYVACNSVGVLSLVVYDRLHGTDYSSVKHRWLGWIRENLEHPQRGILRTWYHPSRGRPENDYRGRHNAWDVIFLHAVEPEYARDLYQNFRRAFGWNCFTIRALKDEPGDWLPDPVSTGFALAAAREVGDRELFGNLLQLLRWVGLPKWEDGKLHYRTSNLLGNTIIFFGKVARLRQVVVGESNV